MHPVSVSIAGSVFANNVLGRRRRTVRRYIRSHFVLFRTDTIRCPNNGLLHVLPFAAQR